MIKVRSTTNRKRERCGLTVSGGAVWQTCGRVTYFRDLSAGPVAGSGDSPAGSRGGVRAGRWDARALRTGADADGQACALGREARLRSRVLRGDGAGLRAASAEGWPRRAGLWGAVAWLGPSSVGGCRLQSDV